jgi:hypothetical protein
MIAVEMGIDDVFDRLAAACLIDGCLDLIVEWREFGIHLDYRILAARNDDISALALQHVGAIAKVGGLHFDLGKIRLLGTGRPGEKHGAACQGRDHDSLHMDVLLC